METLRIDIINPKAKVLLKNLAALRLIRIKKDTPPADLADLLNRLRSKEDLAPDEEEILSVVEEARRERYESR